MSSSGGGSPELVFDPEPLRGPAIAALQDLSPDGRHLIYTAYATKTSHLELWASALSGDRKPFAVAQGGFDIGQAVIAPDGHWVAYTSNETGRNEVYVQSFPMSGGKRAISIDGGVQPRWRRDGRELFYLSRNQQLMAVPITLGSELGVGKTAPLFHADLPNWGAGSPGWTTSYDVSTDGQRFLLNIWAEKEVAPITVVVNWPATLRR